MPQNDTLHMNTSPGLIINGCEVQTTFSFPVINPATAKEFALAPSATVKDLDYTVKIAKNAQVKWQIFTPDEREVYLQKFADILELNKSKLVSLLSLEQGKPVHSGARDEIDFSIYWLREIAKQRLSVQLLEDTGDQEVEMDFEPLGIAGLILPWNFPIALAIWKLAPALITGNAVIIKPSPYTPLTTLEMGRLAQNIFPPGVINVLSGGNELGEWIIEHSDIHKISFTGSIATGKKVMACASAYLKPITLELGGNDAAIVLPDADIHNIVPKLFWGAFGNSGQWCVGIKRLYVHDDIYNKLLTELVRFSKTIVMGNGADPDTMLGPIQNKMQYEKLQNLMADIHKQGYSIAHGGDISSLQQGYFIPVTIVDNPPENSRIVQEEPFGPILPLLRYNNIDEVIDRVNNTNFGLGASIWGNDVALAKKISKRLKAGTIWINEVYVHHPRVPFGGMKLSGFGAEHGKKGLEAYAALKVIMRQNLQ